MPKETTTMYNGSTPFQVEAEVQTIPWNEELDFLNQFGDEYMTEGGRTLGTTVRHGTIRLMAIDRAIKSLTIGHDKFDLSEDAAGNANGSTLNDVAKKYPRLRSEEKDSPASWLVRVVVKHNDWLATDRPYRAVFGQFLPEEEANENPTPAPVSEITQNGAQGDTSTNTQSSLSVAVGDRTAGTTLSEGSDSAIIPHSAQNEE